VWTRLTWDLHYHSRGARFMGAIARLRDGVTLEQAQAELTAMTARFATQFPGTNAGWSARAIPLHTEVVGFFRAALYILLGTVSLLLVIACVNVASLLLARGTAREREVAIRTAIGATRARLVRQFLTESGLLALAGAIVGVGLAIAGVRLLVHATPVPIPRLETVVIDTRVLTFALIVAAATAIGFGLLPAVSLSSVDSQQTLKESGRGSTTGRRRERTRRLLVVGEVGLAVMLLFGAGLLIRTIANLAREDPGFRPAPVLTASLQLTAAAYPKWEQVATFYATLLDRLRERPDVEATGTSNFLPLASGWRLRFLIRGRPEPAKGDEPTAQHMTVSEGYFETIGVPLVAGRWFDAHDTARTEPVVLINQTLARQYFAGENPIGRTIDSFANGIGPLGQRLVTSEHRIIGIVGDVKNHTLQSPAEAAIYHPMRQFPFRSLFIALRGKGDVARLTTILRETVRATDPALPLSDVRTMNMVMADATGQLRLLTYLMTGFAALALLLAIVGIYGMLAYAVSQRQQEISIRLALGASRAEVLWLVLRQGLMLSLAGAALGAAGGLIASRWLGSLLYGIRATDALTLAAVIAIVMGVAAAACLIPARRASSVDPLAGLRDS
jgi:putative ABC transport system permease protein